MKKFWKVFAFVLVLSGVAFAGAIKTWVSGETLTAADLNSNFAHIHNTMVGGHGARLVNADVSASAAISHTKMATPGLLPKAWAIWKTACAAATCAPDVDIGVADVVWNAAGDYSVRLDTGRPNTNYVVLVTAYSAAGADTVCGSYNHGTGTVLGSFGVKCYTAGAAANAAFQFTLLDDDN